jgi:hypothetical protein
VLQPVKNNARTSGSAVRRKRVVIAEGCCRECGGVVPGCKRPGFFGALPVLVADYCLNGFVLPVPAIPSGFATSALTVTGFTLTWSAATGYEFFSNGITAALPPAPRPVSPSSITSGRSIIAPDSTQISVASNPSLLSPH